MKLCVQVCYASCAGVCRFLHGLFFVLYYRYTKALTTSSTSLVHTKTRTNPTYVPTKLSLILIHSFCHSHFELKCLQTFEQFILLFDVVDLTSLLLLFFCHMHVSIRRSICMVMEACFNLNAVLQCNPLKIKRISIYLLKYQRRYLAPSNINRSSNDIERISTKMCTHLF